MSDSGVQDASYEMDDMQPADASGRLLSNHSSAHASMDPPSPTMATAGAASSTGGSSWRTAWSRPHLNFLASLSSSNSVTTPRSAVLSRDTLPTKRAGVAKAARKRTFESLQEGEEHVIPLPTTGANPLAVTDKEVTSLVHLYRAEVGRLTAYRTRLDTTTNWTVTITSALVAFSLGSPSTPHYFFGFIIVMQIIFCAIEGRRHVYYNLVRHRCRLMERGMYAHILEPTLPAANWRRPLRDSYLENAVLMPFSRAFLIRLKRNYCYLILAVYLGWTFKLLSEEKFQYEFFIPVSLIEIPITLYVIFFYRDQTLDV